MKLFKDIRFYKFLIPSLIGAILFVVPVSQGGNLTIPIAIAANRLLDFMGSYALTIIWLLISASAVITVLHKIFKYFFIALPFGKKRKERVLSLTHIPSLLLPIITPKSFRVRCLWDTERSICAASIRQSFPF